jgi:hypothetical protein
MLDARSLVVRALTLHNRRADMCCTVLLYSTEVSSCAGGLQARAQGSADGALLIARGIASPRSRNI